MAVLSKEQLMAKLAERIGDDTSDEVLAFTEDVSDTITDLETKANGDGTDWKAKYEENDKEWREKYKARFFSGSNDEEDFGDNSDNTNKPKTYEDLFKEG